MLLAYLSNIDANFPTFSVYYLSYTKSSRWRTLTTRPPPAQTNDYTICDNDCYKRQIVTRTELLNHVRAPPPRQLSSDWWIPILHIHFISHEMTRASQ